MKLHANISKLTFIPMKKLTGWNRIFGLTVAFFLTSIACTKANVYDVTSPDGKLTACVETIKGKLRFSLQYESKPLILPSDVSLKLRNGITWGTSAKPAKVARNSYKGNINALFYTKETITDNYNQLILKFKEGFDLVVRVYDDGAAYRFISNLDKDIIVEDEQMDCRFPADPKAFLPYVRQEGTTFEQQLINTFENTYAHVALSKMDSSKLAFLPCLIEAEGGIKIGLTEAALQNYPNMYVRSGGKDAALKTYFARYPSKEEQGGYDNLQLLVKERAGYIAHCPAKMKFPWRVFCISRNATELLANDMVYRLAEPCKLKDTGWIKPGKVAWDWWNDWSIYNVPFKAGINTETYKYYIDFASRYGIEYVVLDDGWSVRGPADLMQVVPEIDLKEIIAYGHEKGVGIILWAGSYALDKDLENVCRHYAEMGVKGFKVDVINRDDQRAVDYHYRIAEAAARHKLVLDIHGTFKPAGLNRTYPNVLNFEGVCGMEFNKWSSLEEYDQMNGDVTIPFVRMLAGPMDYTQGAMLNGTRQTYRASGSEPMSQGTRCHQLAEYTVFLSPLGMLCDSPTHYEQEAECTTFISQIPTVWDETIPLCGEVGEYVAIARRKGNVWYVGALTNWTERNLTLDLNTINGAGKQIEVFRDGPNAAKHAQDYIHETTQVPANGQLKVYLAPGGGYTLKMAAE